MINLIYNACSFGIKAALYTYNEINKITKVQTADDLIQYQYNIKDEVIAVSNSAASISYARDAMQRVVQESVGGDNYPVQTLNVEYSKNNLRTSLQSNFQNIAYSYNPDTYQLTGISSSSTGSYNFYYDDTGRLGTVVRPGSRTEYAFDAGSNLSRISHITNNVVKSSHEYNYDLRNYITQKRSTASTMDYSYDSNGQLLSANKTENPSENESFSYDALGNRLTYNGVTSTFDNSGQRIQDDGIYTYVFDANGNIIYKSNKSNKSNGISYAFEYSALNQLKKATVTSSQLGGNVLKILEYKYDPAGRRILRQVTDNVNSAKSSIKKYYYDGDNIIAELDTGDNLTASYTHSPLGADDLLGAKFTSYASPNYAASEGQVLASSVGNVYYLKDHLNTINEITNAAGDIVQKMDYSAFGVLRSVKDSVGNEVGFASAPVRSSFTYTGREYEPELGMYYYRARYYDPNTGRFLQQDPDPGKLGNPNTFLSKYVYTANSPVNFTDSSGRDFLSDLGSFVSNVVAAVIITAALPALLATSLMISIFDPAAGLSLAMLAINFSIIGQIANLLITGKFASLDNYEGMIVVKDSMFGGGGGFTPGPVSFITPGGFENKKLMRHEYGHYLQYKRDGGWGMAGHLLEGGVGRDGGNFECETGQLSRDYFHPGSSDPNSSNYVAPYHGSYGQCVGVYK